MPLPSQRRERCSGSRPHQCDPERRRPFCVELFGSADFLGNNRVVFEIKGNTYRFIAQIKYAPLFLVFIRFVGTHAEYGRIDADEV